MASVVVGASLVLSSVVEVLVLALASVSVAVPPGGPPHASAPVQAHAIARRTA